MRARYVTFFLYRSSEKLWLKEGSNYPDPESVQGLMELALLKLRPQNYPNLTLSSRTDGGVHAINSSAHFDLEKFGEKIYETNQITYEMNKFFFKNDFSIFVRKCLRVNDNFSARFNAISRTYLYRLAVLKPEVQYNEKTSVASFIPIEEWKRCHFIRYRDFDIERFTAGTKYFVGYHDFTTFKKFDKLMQNKHNRREIKSITVSPGVPCVTAYTNNKESYFNYWDIEIKGRSFVHNQIRRMIGTLISVALHKLEPEDIRVMLQVPSKHSWHTFIQNCPPDGLYLCNVEYDRDDLIYDPNKNGSNDDESKHTESVLEVEHS